MTWDIPKMWEGGECWIIGGGPSVPREFGVPEEVIAGVLSGDLPMSAYSPFLSAIQDKHVIGVNAAYLLGDWLDVIFFGDGGFYWKNRVALAKYPKIQVTCNPNLVNKGRVINVKHVPRDGKHPYGISSRRNHVSWNSNSGASAINLAYHFGVKEIYLLGFDMTVGPGDVMHCHSHYRKPIAAGGKKPKKLPFGRHLQGFPQISKDANRLKLKIYNVSQVSKITEFEKVKISEVL